MGAQCLHVAWGPTHSWRCGESVRKVWAQSYAVFRLGSSSIPCASPPPNTHTHTFTPQGAPAIVPLFCCTVVLLLY